LVTIEGLLVGAILCAVIFLFSFFSGLIGYLYLIFDFIVGRLKRRPRRKTSQHSPERTEISNVEETPDDEEDESVIQDMDEGGE